MERFQWCFPLECLSFFRFNLVITWRWCYSLLLCIEWLVNWLWWGEWRTEVCLHEVGDTPDWNYRLLYTLYTLVYIILLELLLFNRTDYLRIFYWLLLAVEVTANIDLIVRCYNHTHFISFAHSILTGKHILHSTILPHHTIHSTHLQTVRSLHLLFLSWLYRYHHSRFCLLEQISSAIVLLLL
jgi:hypothetical protein